MNSARAIFTFRNKQHTDGITRLAIPQIAENRAHPDRLDDIIRLVSDWVWEVDEGLRLTFVSDRIIQVPGYLPLELQGRNLFEIGSIVSDVTPAVGLHRGGAVYDLPFEMTDKAGGIKRFLLSGVPVFNPESGNLAGYRGTARDVTWRILADDELERRIDERTSELQAEIVERRMAETAAVVAMEKTESANRAKSIFLANMSHELRTPLTAIIGFAEAMREEIFGKLVDKRYQDYARLIAESGQHLLDLINDILDISKIEAGELTINAQYNDLRTLIQGCEQMMRERAKKAGIDLSSTVANAASSVYADELRLKQILLNLLSNSIKFTKAGGKVSIGANLDSQGAINITVADTGIGIDPRDIQRVLQPFGQVEDSTAHPHEGSGLGLPLAKSLAELHGGTLTLTSAVGQGTTVTVKLPPIRNASKRKRSVTD